ncbi:MAG: hypothetical protein ACPGXK_16505, partial [Phycisphaerae bacterium]
GPNYNVTEMGNPRSAEAWKAIKNAEQRLDRASPVERALIKALSTRYVEREPEDRTHLDFAYAEAMAEVWSQFPDDPDVGTLYAEAMMIKHPWKLYNRDGEVARDETNTILTVLEKVLELEPNQPGALHLYIHALEPSDYKSRAIPAADRLSDLVPASGHLRHMPSHIYAQVGMWDRSIEQNEKAIAADDKYRELVADPGMHTGYMAHNAHMLSFSAMMVGKEEQAMMAAAKMKEGISPILIMLFGQFIDPMMGTRYDVMKRFGRWDEILKEPAPSGNLPITTAVWRAHRAIALAAKKEFDEARREQDRFRSAMSKAISSNEGDFYGSATMFLLTSELFVEGELLLQEGKWEEAAYVLEDAVAIEDTLGYGEPPRWVQPARHALGAVYMKWERFDEAERVYREDLDKWPGNGWSLFGLARALEEQGKTAEADSVRRQFEKAWAHADEPLETSCKCVPKL